MIKYHPKRWNETQDYSSEGELSGIHACTQFILWQVSCTKDIITGTTWKRVATCPWKNEAPICNK